MASFRPWLLAVAAFGCSLVASAATFWTEDFNNGCTTGCEIHTYAGPRGAWSFTVLGVEGAESNKWYASCAASFAGANSCGSSTCTAGRTGTLHIGANVNSMGDVGAIYDVGGLCGVWTCPQTNRRAESPVVDATGRTNITLTFQYILGGDPPNDRATVWYFNGITWSVLATLAQTSTLTCPAQGQWTTRSITLPGSANNNANMRIAFAWANNDDGVGTDPSIAIAQVVLSAAPLVSSVTVPPNATYGAGQALDFTATFDATVTVTGAPYLPLTVGAASRSAAYVSGSGTTQLLFRYVVAAGELDADGIAVASAIALNGGTIRDVALVDASPTLAGVPSTAAVRVDGQAPLVASIVRAGAASVGAGTAQAFTVTFDEAVTGVDVTDFALSTSGVSGASIVGVTGSGATYTVTVNVGSGTGSVRLDLVDNGSITDGANAYGGPGVQDFTAGQSYAVVTTPGAPTAVAAVKGNALATVSFVAPADGGSPILSYQAISNPGAFSSSGAGSPITVSGLTNGTSYTFTVIATNAQGAGTPSSASNAVTPSTVPGAPTALTAAAGNAQVTVAFTPPVSNGGSPITGYVASCNPGAVSASSASSPIVVAGLANGTGYTCTVAATNANGTGSASSPSNAVTPSTVPGAPTAVTAASGNAQVAISFAPPASNGGSAIIGYMASCSPGAVSAAAAGSPIVVAALTNGTTYTCTVAATNANGSGPASATVSATPSQRAFTGSSATGSGTVAASFTGGGPSCTFASAALIPLSGAPRSPPAGSAPSGVAFLHGLFDFTVTGCAPGAALTFTVVYPQPLPAGTAYYKYGPTSGDTIPHWYVLPATFSGAQVTFTVTDGGLGDDDLAANGAVVDQGGPGTTAALPVPTLGEWAKLILGLLLAGTTLVAFRRTRARSAILKARHSGDQP